MSTSDFTPMAAKMLATLTNIVGEERAAIIIGNTLARAERSEEERTADMEATANARAIEAARAVRIRGVREECGLEGDMWEQTFAAYEPKHISQTRALKLTQLFCSHFPKVNRRGLLLHGKPGTGKSHLLRALAIELVSRDIPPRVLYLNAPEIVRILRREQKQAKDLEGTGANAPDTEKAMQQADLLILCDLGKVDPETTERWFLPVIGEIIDRAERIGKPIVCASANDIECEGGEVVSALDVMRKRLGEAFVSRLNKLMVQHQVIGPDARQEQEVAGWAR